MKDASDDARALACAGGYLRSWRHAAGISQETIARLVGVHHTLVHRWESGSRRPSRAQVIAVGGNCAIDAATIDALLIGYGHAPAWGTDPAVAALVAYLADVGIAPEGRAQVRQIVIAVVRLADDLTRGAVAVEVRIDGNTLGTLGAPRRRTASRLPR